MTVERQRAKPATPEKYLWAKPGARHLWFRYAVPTRYREVEPRKIVQRSTGTRDRYQASVLASRWRADLHGEWETLIDSSGGGAGLQRNPDAPLIVPTLLDLQAAATQAAFVEMQTKLRQLRGARALANAASWQAYYAWLQKQFERLLRTREAEARQLWERVARSRIERLGWLLPEGTKDYELFIGMISEAGLEAIRVDIQVHRDGISAPPMSETVQAGLRAKAQEAKPGEGILDLFERYASQRVSEGRKRLDTVAQDRKVVQQFAAFVGLQRGVRSITKEEVREWRNAVAATPANFAKTKAYAGLPLREVARKAQELGAKPRSATTVSKFTSTVSPFLGWCVNEGYADTNPCDGLHYKPEKGRNRRPPFTDEQLRQMFGSPLFMGFLRDGKEHKPGHVLASDWRCWIPLVCLFTGARIGEIAQLRVQDVTEEHGLPFIHIRDEPSKGQRTKSGKSRPCPIHSQLQALGFLDFVDQQRKRALADGNSQLFAALEANEREQIGATPSRFWRNYLRRIGIKSGADGFGAHSFRHTLADRLRTAGYLDNQIAILLGHSQPTTTSGYGQLPQGTVKMLSEMVESVTFDLP